MDYTREYIPKETEINKSSSNFSHINSQKKLNRKN